MWSGQDMCPEGKENRFLSLFPFRQIQEASKCSSGQNKFRVSQLTPKGNTLELLSKISNGLPEITLTRRESLIPQEKAEVPAEFDKCLKFYVIQFKVQNQFRSKFMNLFYLSKGEGPHQPIPKKSTQKVQARRQNFTTLGVTLLPSNKVNRN